VLVSWPTDVLHEIAAWDATARGWLTAHHHPLVDFVMVALSTIGRASAVWLVLTVSLVVRHRLRARAAATVLIALALANGTTDLVVKPLVARARPFDLGEASRVIIAHPPTYSFPSGHAATAVAAASTLTGLWPAGRAAVWTLATLVAVSRIYVGVHYPLDVLAGALLGWTCACVARRLLPSRRGDQRAHRRAVHRPSR